MADIVILDWHRVGTASEADGCISCGGTKNCARLSRAALRCCASLPLATASASAAPLLRFRPLLAALAALLRWPLLAGGTIVTAANAAAAAAIHRRVQRLNARLHIITCSMKLHHTEDAQTMVVHVVMHIHWCNML